MELQEKVDSLERRVKKQGRFLAVTNGILIMTIAVLITRWGLGIEGRLDLQGKRVYVHSSQTSLISSTISPGGLRANSFANASEAYGKHAALAVTPDRTELHLSADAPNRSRDLKLFVAGNRSGLSIRDDGQRERISLSLSEDGPKLRLLDENGQLIFQAP